MPPRKSAASTVSGAEANGDVSTLSTATNATASSSTQHAHPKSSRQSGAGSGRQDDGVGIDDLLLPRSLVSRLSRGVLPPNTSLQKDALLALTRSATVFISYLAHHANEQSQLRHKKTLNVQDVMAALKEIEFGNVMELGAVGEDGRTGGRLEREVEVYEEIIGRKRRGYREKVKARESGGAEGAGEMEDRGEPSSKKIRRMSAEDEDEEERMLEQQLNGTTGEEASAAEKGPAKTKSRENGGISVVVRNGKGKGKPDPTQEEDAHVDEGGDEDGEEADDDEQEEDEGEEEEDEEEDDQEEDDDEDQDDDDDDDTAAHHADDDDDHDIDVDDSRQANGRAAGRVGLLPDGNVEIASDDESD
ncbi:uncharacterized protein PV07_01543 [Cladophialophora immunda]|uniref:DNA polymerase epsilon subunit D n=1 Tax=Cladophialophora immunda TaxID=569365 RepID=A0A0D2BB35_9EURO|nr:uncharacterized protein PV07_01543 [Cladophialophora immunda]KIW34787.1 hypothetical protein PV07_01543 [Cladophialophora immunda]